MYAVIETGGKQYRVVAGDTIHVEKLEGEVGSPVELGRVLAVVSDGSVDTAPAAKVRGTIASHGSGDKILVFKFKRKKQYKKTIGHRQKYTAVKIDEIA